MVRAGVSVAIAAAALLVAGALALPDAEEPVATQPSVEVRSLAGGDGACPFVQRLPFNLQVVPVPPSPNRMVSDCGYIVHGGIRIERFDHDGPHGFYRLEYVKRSDEDAPTRFIIYLTGGPRALTSGVGPHPLPVQLPVRLAEQERTGILAPSYLGTWTRSLFPRQDTDAAGEEVASLIARVQALHPRAGTSVVAVSAGTFVALQTLRRGAVPTVFVVPPSTSLRELLTDTAGSDVSPNARREVRRFYRYSSGRELEAVTATNEEQMSAFLGPDYHKSLADLIGELPPERRTCIAIVYGTRDPRVRNARLSEVLALFPAIPIRAVEGMGHGPRTADEAETLVRAIVEVMPARCG